MPQLVKMPQVTTFPIHLHNGLVMPLNELNNNNNNVNNMNNVNMAPRPPPPLIELNNGYSDSNGIKLSPHSPPMPKSSFMADLNNNIISTPTGHPTIGLAIDRMEMVGQTPFRIGQVLEWMAEKADPGWMALANKRTLLNVKVQQVAGIGFLSYIYRIQFYFEGVNSPFTVILKVPSIINLSVFSKENEFLSNWAYKLSERHNKEIFCYEHFGRRIAAAGIVHVPKLFHAARANSPAELEKGCILMEDLDRLGIMGNTVLGLSQYQVEGLIRTLARIHAFSLAIPGSEQLLNQLSFKFSLDEADGQAKFNAVRALIGTGHDYWKRHGPLLEHIAGQHELMLLDSHKQFGVQPVLCHGDMWANNVFFERLPDGTAGQELYAIIDWQFSQPNSGLQDIARLVLFCTNSSLKLHNLDKWLELYYDTFAAACHTWGVRCPYSMHLVRRMFLAHFPSEMLFSIVILMQSYGRVEDAGLRTALLGRMISSFEWLRQKMKANGKLFDWIG